MSQSKGTLLAKFVLVVVIVALLHRMGIGDYFSIAQIKEHAIAFKHGVEYNYVFSVLMYIFGYAIIMASTLPVFIPLTLTGGFLFGAWFGMLYSLIAATLGAVISYFFVHYVFGTGIRKRYGEKLAQFNEKINAYGYSYLLILHLLSIFPYFMINTLAALAGIPIPVFIVTTMLGAVPMLFIFTRAGVQLATMQSAADILKPEMMVLLGLLAFLAAVPMVIKKVKQKREK